MPIQVITRTQYKTSDGSTYDSEQKAIDHEVSIEVTRLCVNLFGFDFRVFGKKVTPYDLTEFINNNESILRRVLEIMDKARGDLEAAKRSRDSLDIKA